MDFDLFMETRLIYDSEEQFYTTQKENDSDFLNFTTWNEQYEGNQEEEKEKENGPVEEIFDFFKKSDTIKCGDIPLPQIQKIDGIDMEVQESGISTTEFIEQHTQSANKQKDSFPKTLNSYYKNFLVLLSGWIRNYFVGLVEKNEMDPKLFKKFQDIVEPQTIQDIEASSPHPLPKSAKRRKIYINLKKFSKLFNDEALKPHLSNFLNFFFLRYLMTSKTANKFCLLRFLPVLKQGLIEGHINRLR